MERVRTVPLFPLRGVVLFPSMSIELHVFEPRYRALLSDVLDGPGLFGVPLLLPGHPDVGEEAPPIEPVFGLARVLQYEQHPDGTADVRILGEKRLELIDELPIEVYRRAIVRERPEQEWEGVSATELRDEIADELCRRLPKTARRQLADVVRDPSRGFRPIMYLVANLLLPTPIDRQRLLEQDDPEALGRAVLAAIQKADFRDPEVDSEPDEDSFA